MTEWRKIEEFPNYSVSDEGRVRNDKTGRLRVNGIDNYGYSQLTLTKPGGHRKTYKVHRLVAFAFIPNPQNYNVINHIDGDKTNNRVSNLEWCTNQDNQDHYWKYINNEEHHRKRVESHKGKGLLSDNPNAKSVLCVETGKVYKTLKEAEIDTGANYTKISEVCHSHYGRNTAGGYHWKFIKEKSQNAGNS